MTITSNGRVSMQIPNCDETQLRIFMTGIFHDPRVRKSEGFSEDFHFDVVVHVVGGVALTVKTDVATFGALGIG